MAANEDALPQPKFELEITGIIDSLLSMMVNDLTFLINNQPI